MADLGDKTTLSSVSASIIDGYADIRKDVTNGDYWPEEFWTYPVRFFGGFDSVANYKNEFNTSIQTGFLSQYKRSNYDDVNTNGQWVWRQPGKARISWDIKSGLNYVVLTVQRVKLGSNATVRIIGNSVLGISPQVIQDTNINSTLEHEIEINVTATNKGRIYIEIEYLTNIEYTTDVVYWGGNISVDSSGARILVDYSGIKTISGTVLEDSVPKQRRVLLYDRLRGDLIAQTLSDTITGNFSFNVGYDQHVFVVALDDDTGDVFNALIYDRITARD